MHINQAKRISKVDLALKATTFLKDNIKQSKENLKIFILKKD